MNELVHIPIKPAAARAPHITPVPFGILQRKCACGESGSSGGGACEECKNKEMRLQRHAAGRGGQATVPPVVHDVLRSSGHPLDRGTRAYFEPRFGHDFSQVRVHTDAKAAESARKVNALAYTVGSRVVFGAGQYAPATRVGARLLAHELTHVVQQGVHAAIPPYHISSPDNSSEVEASRTAEMILAGNVLPPISPARWVLQRQDAGTPAGDAGVGGPVTATPPPGPATAAPAATGPAAVASTPALALTATRVAFKNTGALDPANCAVLKPASLGVGAGGTARNNMEMIFRIDGTIPSGTEFDILRTRVSSAWQRDAAGTWAVLERDPAGTNDDHTNDDECLTPQARRIFVVDTPGLPRVNPTGITLVGGSTVSAAATGFVRKFSFAEWVIARNRPMGINWAVISRPTFTFWHSITSVALVGSNWRLVDTPSGQHNEVTLGSINTAGATP